jgi:hypothetical protein
MTPPNNNGKPYISIGAKLAEDEAELFKQFCAARGENVSSVLRRLILTELATHSFLDDARKKALGVK